MSSGGPKPGALAVLVDGQPMPEAEARAFWQRFSDWMEDHKGDLLGFAKAEGFASVHPGVADGRPLLRASRTEAQKGYAPVREDEGARSPRKGSGSSPSQVGGSGSRQPDRSGQSIDRRKSRGKSR